MSQGDKMSTNNDRFLTAYNRLDNYLQSLVVVKGHVNMISYLERISPEKKRAEIKTIREYKNLILSHGVSPGDEKPEVPVTWITWLHNELAWCKRNASVIAPKLQNLLDKDGKGVGSHKSRGSDSSMPAKKDESSREDGRDYYARMYGYKYATPETTTGKSSGGGSGTSKAKPLYEFVDDPPKVLPFFKMPDGYGWVVCNQRGEFLGNAYGEDWEASFANAVVFHTKREADKCVTEIKKSHKESIYPAPYMVVKCIKLK